MKGRRPNSYGTNHHCCVVEIGTAGVLIEGPSGSGKTSLALGLVDAANREGLPSYLVSDDQVLLEEIEGALVAEVPPSIAGKVELRGLGIIDTKYRERAEISLVARLIEDERVERLPQPRSTVLHSVELPLLELPQRHEAHAIRLLMAWLAGFRPSQ